MNIYVFGNSHQHDEISKKVGDAHPVSLITNLDAINWEERLVIFDFLFDDSPDGLEKYRDNPNLQLFINATRSSLTELTFFTGEMPFDLYGLAGDPTFLERPLLEVSAHPHNKMPAQTLLDKLHIEGTVIDDRVGMVTPRILAMIINEAYYTVMEGTASREDIDTGMKLGTNYPMGPFAWTEKWGLANIYELLEALYLDTKDERYKICPLLKQEYLVLT